MNKRVERLRGMRDLLPEAELQQQWLIERVTRDLALAGYQAVNTPVVEQSDLFQASFRQELFSKLYTFRLHQRDLCLRPEYTASLCRLYLDHYQQQALPLRFQYAGPIFRYETPGRGRYRQHTELGVELIGGQAQAADSELLLLACDVLHHLGIQRYRLELGHVGVAAGFIQRLNLDEQAVRLLLGLMEQISRSEEGEQAARERLEALYPPERRPKEERAGMQARDVAELLGGLSIAFDDEDEQREVVERLLWKLGRTEQRRQILYALEFLKELRAVAGPPPGVFEVLRELLDRYGLEHEPLGELQRFVSTIEAGGVPAQQIELNLALGRGVSYYTGLVFEIHSLEDGTQLCGGGRYDQLMRSIGSSRDVQACGFSFGVERLLAQLPESALPQLEKTQLLVIPVAPEDLSVALNTARELRGLGVRCEVDVSERGLSAGLRQAARRQMHYALIIGEDERRQGKVRLRDLQRGEEQLLDVRESVRKAQDEG
jgi:histidyl-tRNA synthetase